MTGARPACYLRLVADKDDNDIVDLRRYRQEAEARAKATRKAAARAGREPLLGGRPRAGLILALAALVVITLWAASQFG